MPIVFGPWGKSSTPRDSFYSHFPKNKFSPIKSSSVSKFQYPFDVIFRVSFRICGFGIDIPEVFLDIGGNGHIGYNYTGF